MTLGPRFAACAAALVLALAAAPAEAEHAQGGSCKHSHVLSSSSGSPSLCRGDAPGRRCRRGTGSSKVTGTCVQLAGSCDCLSDPEREALKLIAGMRTAAQALLLFDSVGSTAGSQVACAQAAVLLSQIFQSQALLLSLLGITPFGFYDAAPLLDLDFVIANLPLLASAAASCVVDFDDASVLSGLVAIKAAILANGAPQT